MERIMCGWFSCRVFVSISLCPLPQAFRRRRGFGFTTNSSAKFGSGVFRQPVADSRESVFKRAKSSKFLC
uniref:Putative secreted peptide n=1 Tax=Anopheles braziliensis TaxID=58242 RepID=A0A2M3ZW09_9DIPT